MIDAVHRHHLTNTRTFIEAVASGPSANLVCGVGFVDLSGFTALTQMLTPAELSTLLNGFSAGDAVMWVSPTAEQLAQAALDLVEHPLARDVGLQVRAGLGYGDILAINGDYFGNAVNLAARLVGAAAPGHILAAAGVHDQLPDWPMIVLDPLMLKGFDEPVTAYVLHTGRH